MEKRYSLKAMITLALIASALTCVVLYYALGRPLGIFTPRFEGAQRYGALVEKIEQLYIGDIDYTLVADNALRGAVYGLDDNWSYYMSAEEYADYIDYSNNQFTGIGVDVELDEEAGGMYVRSVYPDSPAAACGIVITDVITAIDGETLRGLSLDEISLMIDREIGQMIELTVLHADGSTDVLETEYAYVFKDPVSYSMILDDIGYIAVTNFESGAASGFINAVKELREQGARAFVFDVRTNYGGRVSELTYILDYLLPECEIFIDIDRYGRETITYSDASCVDMPAVVLVNSQSYSAAEYFAVMLSEYEYAQTVGERTTGKSRSQITVEMPDGGALHISSAEYVTKNRVKLFETEGYAPDFEIEMSDEDSTLLYYGRLDMADDTQLQKALELLD